MRIEILSEAEDDFVAGAKFYERRPAGCGRRYGISMEKVATRDLEILEGEPVFAGTRVPIKSLFDHLEAGDSIADFLEDFTSVKREQVLAVLLDKT
jgi:uncharacterized protein (DUF433 family)